MLIVLFGMLDYFIVIFRLRFMFGCCFGVGLILIACGCLGVWLVIVLMTCAVVAYVFG